MTIEAGTGVINIIPKTDKFLAALNTSVTKSITAATANATTTSQKLLKGATLGFVALGAAAVVAIGKGITATTNWASEVRSLIRVTGLSAEAASGLGAASKTLGISVDQLNVGFGLLSKNMVNAAPNLTKYGIAVRDANGELLPFEEVLGRVQDKFATLQPGAAQAAFAMNVFGRSGKALIPILARGRDGLEELTDAAVAAGLVMSEQDLEAAKELSIAQRELAHAFEGASIAMGKSFIPVATDVVEQTTKIVEVVSQIPKPVLESALKIAALTGAIALATKVAGFFIGTYRTLTATIAGGVGIRGAVVAEEALTAATAATTTSVEAQIVAIQARNAAIGAGAGPPRSEPLGSSAAGVGALPLAGIGFGGKQELSSQQAIDLAGGPAALKDKKVFEGLTKVADLNADALALVRDKAISYGQALAELGLSADGTATGLGALTSSVDQTSLAIEAAGVSIDAGGRALERLTAISGETADEFRDSFRSAFTEASSAANQAIEGFTLAGASEEAFATASKDAMTKAKAAIADFRDSATQSLLGFTNDALSSLADMTHLSVDKVVTSFKDAAKATRDFGRDVLEISRTGGAAGADLANQLLAAGPAAAGLASFIADASKKSQDNMIQAFGAGGTAADRAAKKITNTIVGTLDVVRDLLQAIAKKWNIDLGLDASKAFSGRSLPSRHGLPNSPGAHQINIDLGTAGSGGHVLAAGGIFTDARPLFPAASGFITQGPRFLVGEGHNSTQFGFGAEAVTRGGSCRWTERTCSPSVRVSPQLAARVEVSLLATSNDWAKLSAALSLGTRTTSSWTARSSVTR